MSFSSLNYFHILIKVAVKKVHNGAHRIRCCGIVLQGRAGWGGGAPPNSGTCFQQKEIISLERRYPSFRNPILTKNKSKKLWLIVCSFHGFGQLWILRQSPWALMWCRLSSSCRQDQISAFDLPAIQRLPPGYIARPLKTRQ